MEAVEKAKKEIHFSVDDEPYVTKDATLTPNYIIKHYAEIDPATCYLVRIKKKENQSFQDKGEKTITVKEKDRFQIILLAPATVSGN